MVERFEFTCPDCDPDTVAVNHGRYVRHSEYEALERENAELRKERDKYQEIITRKVNEKIEAHQRAEAAEADRARLSEALTECALLSGLDNELIEGASVIVTSRMAEIHQHARAAMAVSGGGWPVPEGMVLVPVEPTTDILVSMCRAVVLGTDDKDKPVHLARSEAETAYRAMLTAAQEGR